MTAVVADPGVDRPAYRSKQASLLLIISGLGIGGAERLVLQLAREMQNDGWRVVVVGLETDCEMLEYMDVDGLDIRVMGMTRSPRSVLTTIGRMRQIVRDGNFDIIHAHLFHSLMLSLLLRLVDPTPKVIFTSHNFSGFTTLRRFILRASRRFRHADILLGKDQHSELNAQRAMIIPNGINVPATAFRRRHTNAVTGFRFLYLGRLTDEKNVADIVRGFAQLKAEVAAATDDSVPGAGIPLQLWIAGDGPCRDELLALIAQLDPDSSIQMLGMRSDVADLIDQCDALVMASSWEGLPMVVLEAGARAMPVIAPPVGGLTELLDDECGYLSSRETLVQAMRQALADNEHRLLVGQNLYERVQTRFSMRHCRQAHQALYRAVLA